MDDIVWSYRDSEWTEEKDLVGYDVEADGGSIGKVDAASNETAGQWLVVDTGFWIFGKKRVIPAGVVVGMDHEARRIIISMTKDQVKAAPDHDESDWDTQDARQAHAQYYEPYARR
ncbi:PRC-barrel domain containing protein [Nocardioides zeicaulis]|uniref:PRC-barrel domain containing protein n=1 Tax=Nocardioides zeicaulis TaxID=1776857 RepID=A0ABV6E164_9ACTN